MVNIHYSILFIIVFMLNTKILNFFIQHTIFVLSDLHLPIFFSNPDPALSSWPIFIELSFAKCSVFFEIYMQARILCLEKSVINSVHITLERILCKEALIIPDVNTKVPCLNYWVQGEKTFLEGKKKKKGRSAEHNKFPRTSQLPLYSHSKNSLGF